MANHGTAAGKRAGEDANNTRHAPRPRHVVDSLPLPAFPPAFPTRNQRWSPSVNTVLSELPPPPPLVRMRTLREGIAPGEWDWGLGGEESKSLPPQ